MPEPDSPPSFPPDPPPATAPTANASPARVWMSLMILMAPTIACLLLALVAGIQGGNSAMSIAPLVLLVAIGGSLVAGVIVGIRLARRLVTAPGWRPLAAIGLALACAVASLGACLAGCAGGLALGEL